MPSVRAALARGSLACIGAAALLSSTPAPHNTARVCAQSTAVASLRALLLGSPSTARGASLSRCSLSFDRFVVGAKLRGVASAELSVAAAGWARARWLRESARRQRSVSARVTLCCDALARRAAGAARRGVAAREPPLLRRANKNRRASPAAALRRRRRRRAGSRVWRERTEAVANAFGRACVCALGGRAWRALLRARRELCFVAEAEFAFFFVFFVFARATAVSKELSHEAHPGDEDEVEQAAAAVDPISNGCVASFVCAFCLVCLCAVCVADVDALVDLRRQHDSLQR